MQTKIDSEGTTAIITRRIRVLRNNIFGVYLDNKALEIAQLNLLLRIAKDRYSYLT